MPNPKLTVQIDGDDSGLSKSLGSAEAKVGRFSGGGLAKVAKVAVPVAAVAAAVLKLSKAASAAKLSNDQLATTVKNVGAASDTSAQAIKDATKASAALAFTGTDTRNALGSLVTATGDVAKATELLAIAQDVARASNVDLSVAGDAVAKAYVGQDKALRALMPGITAGATGMETIANAEKAAAGQADIFAESAAGMGIKGRNAFKALAVSIGKVFLPVLEALIPAITQIVLALSTLVESLLPILIPLVNALAKAFTIAGNAISKILGFITQLITKIRELLGPLNEAIGKLGQLNPFARSATFTTVAQAQTAAGRASRANTDARVSGNMTINIYGDPAVIEAKVTSALRSYARRNGPGSVFSPGRS